MCRKSFCKWFSQCNCWRACIFCISLHSDMIIENVHLPLSSLKFHLWSFTPSKTVDRLHFSHITCAWMWKSALFFHSYHIDFSPLTLHTFKKNYFTSLLKLIHLKYLLFSTDFLRYDDKCRYLKHWYISYWFHDQI